GDAGGDERFDAGRRAAVMAAGFQRDIGRGAARGLAGGAKRQHLGMRLPRPYMPAFAHDALALRNDTADAGIGVGGVEAERGEVQRAGHHPVIGGAEAHLGSLPGLPSVGSRGSWPSSTFSWRRRWWRSFSISL